MANDHDHDVIRDSALRWYGVHLGEHLSRDRSQLVDRCVQQLMQQWALSLERANRVALQALGEVEAKGCAAYIDVAHTTSHAVFLVDPSTNLKVAFTAADLLAVTRHLLRPPLALAPTKH